MKVQTSLFYQKSLHTSFKPVLKCKQVDNNLKIYLKDQNSQRKNKNKNKNKKPLFLNSEN